MPTFKHILFPVDFSDQNCGIARYVACMASRYRAEVSLLHVVNIPTGAYPGWPADAAVVDFGAMVREGKRLLDSFLLSEFEGVATKRLVFEGDPAWRIAEYAEKQNVDLIMMPTHGYGPFRRFILGSITAKVLHDVKSPVWTSAHVPEPPALPTGYRNVLCAVDLTPQSLPLVQWASGFAREQGAALKLVQAIPAAEPRTGIGIEGGKWR